MGVNCCCSCCGRERKIDGSILHDKECIWFEDPNNPTVERMFSSYELLPDGSMKSSIIILNRDELRKNIVSLLKSRYL